MLTGIYHYQVKNWIGGFTHYKMKVEILAENKKGTTWHIRYLEFHANGNSPGYTTYVNKRKISINGMYPNRKKNNIENIRQPYKD